MNRSVANRKPRIVHQGREETSRLLAMALGRYFQRVCRLYRTVAAGDIDLAIIASAASLAGVESAMRDPAFRQQFANLQSVIGEDRQRGCNALSIAEATGLPRETVRRKMKRLVDLGFLVRRDGGDYVLRAGVVQSSPHTEMVEELAAETLRLLNECLEQGIFAIETPPP
jgi:hypothetical protein